MKPLTIALDILQREDHCFYGACPPSPHVQDSRPERRLSQMTAGSPDATVQVGHTTDKIYIIIIIHFAVSSGLSFTYIFSQGAAYLYSYTEIWELKEND